MSSYSGRRGPNVSQYLRELNTVKPQDAPADETITFDDDLAMFTNTQFFDFDAGTTTDFQAQPAAGDESTPSASSPDAMNSGNSAIGELAGLDFMSGEFAFSAQLGRPSLSFSRSSCLLPLGLVAATNSAALPARHQW
jgi:hypothetical protein